MTESSSVEWRPVVGYEGVYEISNDGQVKRVAGGQGAQPGIRALGRHPNGYMQVVLSMNNCRSTKKVHRLVAEAFIGPCPDGMEACHANDDPGDNRVDNLRWDTHQANCAERETNGKPRKRPAPASICRNKLHVMDGDNVTIATNGWRMCVACLAAKNKRRIKGYDTDIACRNGHPRTNDSLYISPNGRRDCRECRRIVDRKRRTTTNEKETN